MGQETEFKIGDGSNVKLKSNWIEISKIVHELRDTTDEPDCGSHIGFLAIMNLDTKSALEKIFTVIGEPDEAGDLTLAAPDAVCGGYMFYGACFRDANSKDK